MIKIVNSSNYISNFNDGGLYVRLIRLKTRKGKPLNKMELAGGSKSISDAHAIFFDVVNGMYQPNFLGKKLGAKISSNSFTILFDTLRAKDLAFYSKADTVNIIRYDTI